MATGKVGPTPTPRRWRTIVDGAVGGARNMAVDHALAMALAPGTGVLRLYRWREPTLSFGRNEPSRGRYDEAAARSRGVAFVRRPTGGRAVLHDRELTYAVVVEVGALGGLRQAYRRINGILVSALRSLGAGVGLAAAARHAGPSAGPCFDAPADGEVTAAGRKLVGSAQVRLGRSILQHGSIMLDGDQRLIAELGSGAVPVPPATLAELLGRAPRCEEVETALVEAFRSTLGGVWVREDLTDLEARSAEGLEAHYGSAEWTWRR